MASTSLEKTFGQVGNRQTWTFSAWIKRAGLGTGQNIFSSFPQSTDYQRIMFNSSDKLYNAEVGGGATAWEVETDAVYRDTSAWYHLVLRQDTTEATADNRVRIYINNVQQTFGTNTQPAQNRGTQINTADVHKIGKGDASEYFDGEMSHIHWCDGQSYAPTAFGEYDANGVWKIKTSPSVTYGTNGFFILKDGNSVTDQSGNGNNWTVSGGTLTNTEDNPSNVFCVLNKLQKPYPAQSNTLGLGNTKYADNSASWQRNYGTIGATTGKWFYEFKNLQDNNNTGECRIGWDSIDFINDSSDNYYSGLTIDRAGKLRGGIKGVSGYSPNEVQMTAAYSGGDFTFTANDILGMAIDLDNETFSVYKNGNLEINAYSYAGVSNNSISKSRGYFIAPSVNWYSSTGDVNRGCFNFGNGYFEATAVSSAGTNASGNGIFEYDVPTGYTAFCTKGLNGE